MSAWIGDKTWWDADLISTCQANVAVGHYDDAVREAFIIVERRIRELADLPEAEPKKHGRDLIFSAINESKTYFARRLRRLGVELESARFFISGGFGLIRNPVMHALVGHDRETCIAILRAANLMLRLIEQGRASVEDLWDMIQHPLEAAAADAALRKLLEQGPTVLRELLMLRGESIEHENQPVIDFIDSNLPAYLGTLRRQRNKRQLWTEIKELLLQMLRDDEDVQVRRSVIHYLQFFPDRPVSKALCDLLRQANEQPEEVIVALVDTHAILKTPMGRKAVAEVLSQDPSPGVKTSAIEALGEMGHARYVVEALTAVLERAGWRDRKRAIAALKKINAREARPALHRCLADKEWEIQIEACKTLGKFAEADSTQPLGELLSSARAEDVRRAAACALGKIRTDVSFAYLEQCQRSETAKPDDNQDGVLLEIIAEAQQTRVSLTTEEDI